MRDLAIHGDDLVVATHGRGFWVLDDITPLRQISDEAMRADTYLFRPADAVSLPPPGEYGTPKPRDEALAENPPYGAIIEYYLKSAAAGPVVLEILDPRRRKGCTAGSGTCDRRRREKGAGRAAAADSPAGGPPPCFPAPTP